MCRGVESLGVLFKADPEPPDVGAGNWTAIIESVIRARNWWDSSSDPPPSTQFQLVTSTYLDSSLFSCHNQGPITQFVQITQKDILLELLQDSQGCHTARNSVTQVNLGKLSCICGITQACRGQDSTWLGSSTGGKQGPAFMKWNGLQGNKVTQIFFLCSMAVWFSLSCSLGRIHPKNKQIKAMCILCLSTQHWMKRPLLLHYLVVTVERWSGESQERQR